MVEVNLHLGLVYSYISSKEGPDVFKMQNLNQIMQIIVFAVFYLKDSCTHLMGHTMGEVL